MKTVMVSGGFDLLHVGHVRLVNAASFYGDVAVALNSDDWLLRKKGYLVMPWDHRAELIMGLEPVRDVFQFDDADDTACAALRQWKPRYFANGGDRTVANLAEAAVCKEFGIEQVFNVGGGKVASSSELARNAAADSHEYAYEYAPDPELPDGL